MGAGLAAATADGEKLQFTLRSPFQELLSVADHPNELAISVSYFSILSHTRLSWRLSESTNNPSRTRALIREP